MKSIKANRPSVVLRPTLVFVLSAVSALCGAPSSANAGSVLPAGGRFVAGTGSMTGNSTSLTINQTSSRGVIDWNSFSIGNGNHVVINNGTGATLNRVTGADHSWILGELSATGSVYLINPQGIVFGNRGVVSTGGRFVASTLDVDNTAFMNGTPFTFASKPGASNGFVVNLGKLASTGGDVLIIANNEAANAGSISAPKGTAEIAAGQRVLLKDSAVGQQVFVQSGSGGKIFNRGAIEAAQISLQAADGNIFALAGKHSILRATGTASRDGHVWLVADTGGAWLGGTIEASNANGSGGTVDTDAKTLRIAGGAIVKANQWNITTPAFTIDGLASRVFQSNLDRGTSINLQTTGAGGASGNIDVASGIHWIGAASLTLGAYHSLTIEAAADLKNCGNGNLTLRADAGAIDNGGSITNKGTVDWSASRGIVNLFYDMNGSYEPGRLLANATWTPAAYSGLVTQITGYRLVNSLADLENVNADLAGNYALGRDIDASATSGGSYVPIGSGNTSFTGQFDGQGYTISSLTVDGLPTQSVGMFASIGKTAVVRDLNVNGHATINWASDDTPTSGSEGILAGENDGTILRVNTSGVVDAAGSADGDITTGGGLVGTNRGTIERSSSSASVTTGGYLGGLVGENDGVVAQSFASGQVTGGVYGVLGGVSFGSPGGLVGTNSGTITQSYATASILEGCGAFACTSGAALVYNNVGTTSQSFANGAITAAIPGAGGQAAGIAVQNSGTIANDVYWNRDTTGATSGVAFGTPTPAANGLTTAQMSDPSSFAGWHFGPGGDWVMPAGETHPVLAWQLNASGSQ